jgi:hypothetical protein
VCLEEGGGGSVYLEVGVGGSSVCCKGWGVHRVGQEGPEYGLVCV